MDEEHEVKEETLGKQPKRKYREVVCRKCGTVYSSLYRECPECGFSLLRELLKIAVIILLVVGLTTSDVILTKRVKRLEEEVDSLSKKTESLDVQEVPSLTSLDYYKKNLIYKGANLSAFGDDYLIYALQDGCSACEEANEYIYMYLYYGYPDYLSLMFITPDSAEELFFEKLNCSSTPTLYRMHGDMIFEKAEGVEDVFNMIDRIIKDANKE